MIFNTRHIIASLAIINAVRGLGDLPSPSEAEAIHEPALSSNFQIYETPVEVVHASGSKRNDNMDLQDKIDIALTYLRDNHQITRRNVRITDAYTSETTGMTHVYARQTAGGIDVVNGVTNVNIDPQGRVVSSSHTFAPVHQIRRAMRLGYLTARTDHSASLKAAFKALNRRVGPQLQDDEYDKIRISTAASDSLGNTPSGFIIERIPPTAAVGGKATAEQSLMQRADGSLVHVWDIVLEQDYHRWNARVNVETGDFESLQDLVLRYRNQRPAPINDDGSSHNNFVSDDAGNALKGLQKRATYRVIPINRLDPTAGFEDIANPEDINASPRGWLHDGNRAYTATLGNNVIVYRERTDATTRQTAPNQFIYNWNPNTTPTTPSNLDVSRVNLFYVANSLHDVLYRYGFTERAFNFQRNNFNRGGRDGDQVEARVHDGNTSSRDYGSIYTPADGWSPIIRTYLSNVTNPFRDAALSVDIISGLYTLGAVSRMVGGGTTTCMNSLESASLQRGYADSVSGWLSQTSAQIRDVVIGKWISNNPGGIRRFPYSTNTNTNPLRFSSLSRLNDPNDMGEVWANALHNLLAAFASAYGWSATARTNPDGREGNIRFMHLLVDSLALSPCTPTFLHARNAFIHADQNRYRGAHYCLLWRAFASRGLGYSARSERSGYTDGFDVPQNC